MTTPLPAIAPGHGPEILAQTLWAEAATRPVRAVEALAALVVNRARAATVTDAARLRFAPGSAPLPATGWPLLLGAVCRAPFLFGCWNPRHPGRARLGAAPAGCEALAMCRRVAARAATGTLPDPTGGATHWHDATTLPGWAVGRVTCAEIAGVVFYRLGGEAGLATRLSSG